MPEASGVTSFARRAFGPLAGFAAAWTLLLDSIILVAIACSFVPHYLSVFWPQLQDWPYSFLIGLGALVLLVALNVLGLQESVRLSSFMTLLGLLTLVLLLIVGFLVAVRPGVVWSQIDLGSGPYLASPPVRRAPGGGGVHGPRCHLQPRRERAAPGPRHASGAQRDAAAHRGSRSRPRGGRAVGASGGLQRGARGHVHRAHGAGPGRARPRPRRLRTGRRPLRPGRRAGRGARRGARDPRPGTRR